MKKINPKKRYDTKEYVESFFMECLSEIKSFLPSLDFQKSDNGIKINGSEDTGFYIEIVIDDFDMLAVSFDPKISSDSYNHYHPLIPEEDPYNEEAVKDSLSDVLRGIMRRMSNRFRIIKTSCGSIKHQRLVNGVWENISLSIFEDIKNFLRKNQDNYKIIGRNYVLSTEDDHNKLELFFKKLRKEL